MSYNKIIFSSGLAIVLLIGFAVYFFGNASSISQQKITEEITISPSEI